MAYAVFRFARLSVMAAHKAMRFTCLVRLCFSSGSGERGRRELDTYCTLAFRTGAWSVQRREVMGNWGGAERAKGSVGGASQRGCMSPDRPPHSLRFVDPPHSPLSRLRPVLAPSTPFADFLAELLPWKNRLMDPSL